MPIAAFLTEYRAKIAPQLRRITASETLAIEVFWILQMLLPVHCSRQGERIGGGDLLSFLRK